MEGSPRILFIDAYDSFTNNIVGLVENNLNAEVTVVRMDDPFVTRHFKDILKAFNAVIVGPGPGHPAIPKDVGVIQGLWTLNEEDILPVFGICLGFQSLGYAFGAQVKRLPCPRHGLVTRVQHCGSDIFGNIESFEATQYHSFHVDLGKNTDEQDLWSTSAECPELQPLAWDLQDKHMERILMAHCHTTKPFWGVQFHPESICTTPEGKGILCTWWEFAQKWSIQNQRRTVSSNTAFEHLLKLQQNIPPSPSVSTHRLQQSQRKTRMLWSRHSFTSIDVPDIVEALQAHQQDVIFLDSQGHNAGRYSILGLIDPDHTRKLTYSVHSRQLACHFGKLGSLRLRLDSQQPVWSILQDTMVDFANLDSPDGLPQSSPFWGGWMGYVSYEAGLDSLDISISHSAGGGQERPDFNFAFISRSIVVDHEECIIYVQSLITDDCFWVSTTTSLIENIQDMNHSQATEAVRKSRNLTKNLSHSHISKPLETTYRQKVLDCQESLRAGDSYELCLTDETQIMLPTETDPWQVYRRLRMNNAAPFGAFMRLAGATVVGSSPERFLHWSRSGRCQLRPIKGTVRKTPEMTYDKASAILNTSKERAENLMIVDLIRHDLSGVCGAQSCTVPKLMQVEEYQTVFQLVSVIEGQLPRADEEKNNLGQKTGVDVLKASLPPGSMTGAPKKRSCEILADLENRPRGLYSGVLGYMDVGGAGDFAVVIRTAFRWDDEIVFKPSVSDPATVTPHHVYRVGAGGAVTIQSTDKGEYDEMETKLDSVLKTFQECKPKASPSTTYYKVGVSGLAIVKEQSL